MARKQLVGGLDNPQAPDTGPALGNIPVDVAVPSSPPTRSKSALDIPCAFGGVSIGDNTARISITIERRHLSLRGANFFLCGTQCEVELIRQDQDEPELPGMDHEPLTGIAEIKGFRVARKELAAGLTFNIEEVHAEDIARFAQQKGKIKARRMGVSSHDGERQTHPDDGTDDDAQPLLFVEAKVDGDWRGQSIDALLDHGAPAKAIQALRDKDITTLGAFGDFTAADRGLTWFQDVKGIGEAAATKISDAFANWCIKHRDLVEPTQVKAVEPAA